MAFMGVGMSLLPHKNVLAIAAVIDIYAEFLDDMMGVWAESARVLRPNGTGLLRGNGMPSTRFHAARKRLSAPGGQAAVATTSREDAPMAAAKVLAFRAQRRPLRRRPKSIAISGNLVKTNLIAQKPWIWILPRLGW